MPAVRPFGQISERTVRESRDTTHPAVTSMALSGRTQKTMYSADHVFGATDLQDTVAERVSANWRRENLYPARWALWLLTTALPDIPAKEFRILDVIRGRTFSLDHLPLHGNEEDRFRRRYVEVLHLRDTLR